MTRNECAFMIKRDMRHLNHPVSILIDWDSNGWRLRRATFLYVAEFQTTSKLVLSELSREGWAFTRKAESAIVMIETAEPNEPIAPVEPSTVATHVPTTPEKSCPK